MRTHTYLTLDALFTRNVVFYCTKMLDSPQKYCIVAFNQQNAAMSYNIVLVYPEIPNNTGNIGRLCLAANATLHLIEPLGFKLSDKYIKRAGLQYWPYLNYHTYASWDYFLAANEQANLYFFSKKAQQNYWDCTFAANDFLVFGCESVGLPPNLLSTYADKLYKIPQYNERVRCLNLANAVGIVTYEALRQLRQ